MAPGYLVPVITVPGTCKHTAPGTCKHQEPSLVSGRPIPVHQQHLPVGQNSHVCVLDTLPKEHTHQGGLCSSVWQLVFTCSISNGHLFSYNHCTLLILPSSCNYVLFSSGVMASTDPRMARCAGAPLQDDFINS